VRPAERPVLARRETPAAVEVEVGV
jgi:hypothetical protein